MPMANWLPHTRTIGQFVKFLAVGGSNLVLTYVVYLLALIYLAPVPSILIAVAAGLVFTAMLNIRVVFKKDIRFLVLLATLIYYVVYSAAYAALLDFVILWFSLPAALAPVPVLCLILPLHFLCSRFIILRLAHSDEYAGK